MSAFGDCLRWQQKRPPWKAATAFAQSTPYLNAPLGSTSATNSTSPGDTWTRR